MTYALIIDNTIQSTGRLPESARRIDTDEWVMGLDTAPPDLLAATGWAEVVDTPRPDDTTTTTHDHSVELVNGTPTVVWTERAKTQDELDAETQQTNEGTLNQRADTAIGDLRTIRDSSGNLTNAQLSSAVRAIAGAGIVIIRLLIRKLDGTE